MKKMCNPIISFAAVLTVSFAGMLAACGDDSSSNASVNDAPQSSGSVVDPNGGISGLPDASVDEGGNSESMVSSSGTVVDVPISSAVIEDVSVDNPLLYTIDPSIAVSPDVDGFYDIADIYHAVPATSKIAFVIRHTEREEGGSKEIPLTADGIATAQALGARMGGDEPFYYASTDFVRTRETAFNIALGRGEAANVVTWDDGLDGNYFYREDASISIDSLAKKSLNLIVLVSRYCYDFTFNKPEVNTLVYESFYPLFERGHQFVNEVVLDNMPSWNRVSILVTHDVLAEPLVVYASNRTINLRNYIVGDSRWVNYMSGIAVVLSESGKVSLYPVRGYEKGWR